MLKRWIATPVTLGGFVLVAAGVAACGGDTGETGGAEGEAAREEARAPQPDTMGAGMWSFLQEVDYQGSWQLWPDKGQLYQGQEPHGMLLTTYLNDLAHDALTNQAGSMPDGAIVVKENYAPDSTLAAVTVMYKKDGFDPEHNDWFWVKFLADGSVDMEGKAQGRVQGCIQCHGGKADNDYIMTSSLGQ